MAVNTLPMFFNAGGESSVNSYDFTDAAAGIGYLKFYGMMAHQAANNYMLAVTALKSTPTYTDGTSGNYAVETLAETLDFPITIQRTVVAEGKAFVVCYWGNVNGGGDSVSGRIKVIIEKNGTEVVSGYSSSVTLNAAPASGGAMTSTVALTVPQTALNQGDTLNLSIEFYATNAVTTWEAPRQPRILHDPQTAGQELLLYLPVKIDI